MTPLTRIYVLAWDTMATLLDRIDDVIADPTIGRLGELSILRQSFGKLRAYCACCGVSCDRGYGFEETTPEGRTSVWRPLCVACLDHETHDDAAAPTKGGRVVPFPTRRKDHT